MIFKSILLAKMDEGIAASQHKQTEAIFLPQVGFSYSALPAGNDFNDCWYERPVGQESRPPGPLSFEGLLAD